MSSNSLEIQKFKTRRKNYARKIKYNSGINNVEFRSNRAQLKGLMFVPAMFNETKVYPTIIYSGPMTQIKKQTGAYYGKKADTANLTIEFYNNYSEPKELFEVKGVNHVDLYDKDEFVDQVVDRLDTFFKKY